MSRDVKQASTPHLNKTFTVYTSLVVQSDRNDHGKVITCEAFQKETDIRITTNTTLDVLCEFLPVRNVLNVCLTSEVYIHRTCTL